MTPSSILRALPRAAVLLIALAAAGFALIVWTIEGADHAAIRAALIAAPAQDLGVPELERRIAGFEQGYFPDCAGLAILTREDAWPNAAYAALRSDTILPRGNAEMCLRLQKALRGADDGPWFTYARYWHGALVVHRLVLGGGADYAALQGVAAALLGVAALLMGVSLAWRIGPAAALALTLAAVLLTDARAVAALPVQATGFAALFLAVALFAASGARRTGSAALIAAAVSGGLLNFFDFLYTPAAFAMLNAWVWLAAARPDEAPRSARDGLYVFAASLGGYGAFWAVKWALAISTDPTGQTIFVFGANEFTRWGPGNGGYFPFAATAKIVAQTFDAWWKGGLAAAIVLAAWAWARRRGAHAAARFAVLLSPVLPALAVIEAMAGHTMAHPAFTFRIVPLAIGLGAASLIVVARQTMPAARKAAISAAP